MKLVFLCGGIGKRMFPLTEDKFMLKFLGKTLLEHQIEIAKKAGFKDFVIVGNPLNIENIKELCKDIDAKIEFGIQEEPTGMANALLSVKDMIKNDEIVLVNPNDVFDQSVYKKILTERKKSDYESYIVGYKVKSYFPGGYLELNENNELIKIHEKPGEGNEPSDIINIVVHLHRNPATLLEYLEKTRSERDDVYECSISKMVEDGHKIKVVKYEGFWCAIKYPWDIFDAVKYFLDNIKTPRISKRAKISKKAKIYGGVIIEDNVHVLENAVIRGPCYIGENTVIGNNVLIWNYTHVGANCVVGYSTEIKHSYIGDNCWFHMSYVGDSIISNNCSFGAGTITANFRFDEKPIKVTIKGMKSEIGLDKLGVIMGSNCKTGVNSCIMPGVKVGPNSILGPSVTLTKDLEPNKMIVVNEKSYIIKENEVTLSPEKKKSLMERLLRHGYGKKD
ncbi:MAG: sugar phosphate nucleotidyltransferase [Candidatus Aenigmarchaeota archaeon]|nr:sugar phosphate nucleotidyltransferase [Candidatus Aenigmarchaeota archaeon]